MAETLLICPFCGGEAKEFTGEDAAPHRWTVECDSCGAHVGSDTRHKARAKWNRRAERTCLWNGGCGLGVYLGPYDEDTGAYDLPSTIEAHHLTCGHTAYTEGEIPSYCPNCGARVMEEEA